MCCSHCEHPFLKLEARELQARELQARELEAGTIRQTSMDFIKSYLFGQIIICVKRG